MQLRKGFEKVGGHLDAEAKKASAQEKEHFYRSAISRTYYAAFHHAREYAEKHLGFRRDPHSSDDHARLCVEIDKVNPTLGNYLETMRRTRNRADYGDPIADCAQTSELMIELLKTFTNGLYI